MRLTFDNGYNDVDSDAYLALSLSLLLLLLVLGAVTSINKAVYTNEDRRLSFSQPPSKSLP